jgi:hypothetical protein
MVTPPSHLHSIVDHDGAIILDISTDQFFSMNPVGAYIWQHLLKGEWVDEIARALAEETGAEISVSFRQACEACLCETERAAEGGQVPM